MKLYNTMTRQKEEFVPMEEGKVKMYVCGPTVYDYIHIGNARPYVVFDTVRRYLEYKGYEVTYVQNFTDVDDKIINRANKEGKTMAEISNKYIEEAFRDADGLNVKRATVHPRVTEEMDGIIAMVQTLIDKGFAYEDHGTVYYDTKKFPEYGKLSRKNLDELIAGASERVTIDDAKKNPTDFVLWKPKKEGEPSWTSPWGEGRPGWHIECSVMSKHHLGDTFDIHAGGEDLIFPHHECEIAQAVASQGDQMVHYWMHNNMITINGQKMGKSLGNFITLEQFFTGNHDSLEQAYSPMTIRFFILSAHYRSTVDFSNDALKASQKGLERLMNGLNDLERVPVAKQSDDQVKKFVSELRQRCYDAMNDDFQTQLVISYLFEACHVINTALDHKANISAEDLKELSDTMHLFTFDLLGLKSEKGANNDAREEAYGKVVDMVLNLRAKAKADKDWATSDQIRDALAEAGFEVKDTKDGVTWKLNK